MRAEIGEFADTVGRFMEDRCPTSTVRDRIRCDPTAVTWRESQTWQQLAVLGLTSLGVPERAGGAGLELAAVGHVIARCGRHIPLEPLVSTVALATPLLVRAANERSDELLSAISAGDSRVAVALPSATAIAESMSPIREERGNGTSYLTGTVQVVRDLRSSDVVLVPARIDCGISWWGIPVDCVPPTVDGVLLDGHGASRLELDGFALDPSWLLARGVEEPMRALATEGAALVSAYLMGIAEQALSLTVGYLREREQFGVKIGSFQALQHRVARLHVELVVCRSVVETALLRADAGEDDAALWVHAAKARAGALAHEIASEGVQLFGGIGMTAEADIGLYLKAARVQDVLLGHHLFHRHRAAQVLGLVDDGFLASPAS